ncbi:MAG: OmpA family protein, partial [Hyphomicrobiaceae bacterium]
GTRLLHDKNAKRDLGNGSNSNAPVAKRDPEKQQHANAAHAASSVMQAVPPGSEANNQVTKPAGVVTPRGNEASAKASAARIAKARQLETTAAKIRREAEEAKRKLGATGGPGIDVTIEGEDIVVSLTDTSSFGMFAVGSAVPNTGLVSLVSSITPLVAANGNRIILRGHTDARPFLRDGKNQNWRLAMERAEAAYEMLLKAGIDDARFEKIEAYADRKPKIPADPQAAANRRIEIILRK